MGFILSPNGQNLRGLPATRTHTHTHAHTHAHTHTRPHTHTRTHTHTHARTHARTHTHAHTHKHTPTHTNINIHTWILVGVSAVRVVYSTVRLFCLLNPQRYGCSGTLAQESCRTTACKYIYGERTCTNKQIYGERMHIRKEDSAGPLLKHWYMYPL